MNTSVLSNDEFFPGKNYWRTTSYSFIVTSVLFWSCLRHEGKMTVHFSDKLMKAVRDVGSTWERECTYKLALCWSLVRIVGIWDQAGLKLCESA